MAQTYDFLAGWKAAKDAFRADLLAAANSVLPDSVLEGVHVGKPRAYGGQYPAWQLFRLLARGQSEGAERFMPGEMTAQILVVYPATSPPGSDLSGRSYAEDITEEGASQWIDELWDLGQMERFTRGFQVSSEAMGAEDEFGHSLFVAPRVGALWATSLEVTGRL